MKITLHIGQSKTGTSAIQSFLTLHRDALIQQGILYPTISVWGMPIDAGSHNAVADAIAGKIAYPFVTAEKYREAFFGEAFRLGLDRMILSAEHFIGGEPRIWDVTDHDAHYEGYRAKVQRTTDWLKGHDVELLVYLRPHASWLASSIAQNIRTTGLVAKIDASMTDMQFFNMFLPLLRYEKLLTAWREILGPNKITIVPYRRDALLNGNSVDDFMLQVGIDGSKLPQAQKQEVNSSLTREYLEVQRALNKTPRTKSEIRTSIKCLEALSRTSSEPTSYALSPDAMAAVDKIASEDNEAMAREFGLIVEPESVREFPPLRQPAIDAAMTRFQHEMARPHYRRMKLIMEMKDILRRRALPLHTLLHRVKRARVTRMQRKAT